jgi:hypothetical protein
MSAWVMAVAVAGPVVVGTGVVVGAVKLLTGALDHNWRDCSCVECMRRRERSFQRMKELQYKLGPAPRVATSVLKMGDRVYVKSQAWKVLSTTSNLDGGMLIVLSHVDTGEIARAQISWHRVDDPLWYRV